MITKLIPGNFSHGNFHFKKNQREQKFFSELVIGNFENSKFFACLVIRTHMGTHAHTRHTTTHNT